MDAEELEQGQGRLPKAPGVEEMACEEKLRGLVCSSGGEKGVSSCCLPLPAGSYREDGARQTLLPGEMPCIIPGLFKQHPNDDYSPVINQTSLSQLFTGDELLLEQGLFLNITHF